MSNFVAAKNASLNNSEDEPKVERVTYIKGASVSVSFPKPSLDTKEDVENYIEQLKARYLEIIEEDKRISL